MNWYFARVALLAFSQVLLASLPLAAQNLLPISANDNRTAAGTLKAGVLTLSLEMSKGEWHPEKEDGEAIPVYAFREKGKPLQVPGPTIRVPQGTMIDISLHSQLAVNAILYGLHQRPGSEADVVTVAAGATQHVRFAAGKPGTYLYWARTPDGKRGNGRVVDALLGGALIVDPPGTVAQDRIFVLERWNGPTRTAINGKSWPYTERLNYEVGQRVRWRIINASDLSHPMHLHGFHFSLDGEGDGENFKLFEPDSKPLEFTHSVQIAQTFDMTWVPSEPGRWLYHCHRMPHMRLPVPLDPNDASTIREHDHEQMHDMNSDYAGMGGMIMGITVTGRSVLDTSTSWKPERKLELTVDSHTGGPPFYQLALRGTGNAEIETLKHQQTNAEMSTGLTGPVIVLQQKQPVEIAIINKLKEPTSIHWHGMEIQSYYDGVPGWGGLGDKKTPAVEPGKTFTVRMMPQRSGTFIYHTHWHDDAQLTGGVHGALIVMPANQTYDRATDKSFLFSLAPTDPFGIPMLLMNGVPQPSTLRLKIGTTYRFRFINITPSMDNLRVSLRKAGAPVEWHLVAKDAADVKGSPVRLADQPIAVGETFDFEYRTETPQELALTGLSPGDNRHAVQILVFSDR